MTQMHVIDQRSSNTSTQENQHIRQMPNRRRLHVPTTGRLAIPYTNLRQEKGKSKPTNGGKIGHRNKILAETRIQMVKQGGDK